MNPAETLNEQLIEELGALTLRHCALFAAATSERLLPNYQAFSLLEGWGDYSVLRSSLDYVWSNIIANNVPVTNPSPVKKMRRLCLRQMPDADDFVSLFGPLAQEAIAGIVCALESIEKGDAIRTADFAWICTRTVKDYLAAVSTPYLSHAEKIFDFKRSYRGDWDTMDRLEKAKFWREQNERMDQEMLEWIWSSLMMESELGTIKDDINFLKRTPQLDPAIIEGLREVAVKRGIRPIQRRLVALPTEAQQ